MLVEELLQLLVDVVDADLLKAVVVKDLEAGNVEDTDVGDLLHGWVAQSLVTDVDNNPVDGQMISRVLKTGYSRPEGTLVDGTGNAGNRVGSSLAGGALLQVE